MVESNSYLQNQNEMETNIITMNVRGIGNNIKRKNLFEWYKNNKFDIILMQEVHCSKT